ncbi:MAG: protein phosphatase 2C domain-containing protein [Pseudomonadota bacterium]
MAAIEVIECVNSPGKLGRTGDDRYGFDAQMGTAWVLDGATDATGLMPFPGAESGAAWIAETLSDALLATPPNDTPTPAYFRTILETVRERAEGESEVSLEKLPPEALPIASGIWMRRLGYEIEFAWLGDCMALDFSTGDVIGPVADVETETHENREVLKLTEAEIWEQVRLARAARHASGKPIFSLQPADGERVNLARRPARSGAQFALMSDGFYRLIEPYGLYSGRELAREIAGRGLAGLITQLRDHEASSEHADLARIKRSDDACALWLEIS